MAVQKTDRDQLINTALELFRLQGYHRTSMADIGAACGLLKGSLYHYYPSKEALARAVMVHIIEECREQFFVHAIDDERPAAERLKSLAKAVETYFSGHAGGCLMGNFALEAAIAEPGLAEPLRRYFDDWAAAVGRILGPRYGKREADALARDWVVRVQGALMIMRFDPDPAPSKRACRDFAGLLN